MGKGKKIILSISVILIVLSAIGLLSFKSMTKPVDSGNSKPILIDIPMGSSVDKIADILKENNIIKNVTAFKIKMRFSGKFENLKAGTYELNKSMNNDDVILALTSGKTGNGYVTIPEGYDMKNIAKRLSEKGIMTEKEFYDEAKNGTFDYAFLKSAPKNENMLEGYLYPETYNFSKEMSSKQVLNIMLSEFDKKFTDDMERDMKKSGLDYNQIVTMASIIQKEAGSESEMPKIASVFYNRLKINMPLQSCSTVQYVLGKTKPKLSVADTRTPSPYNTYLHKNLPPGPICSPGAAALKAAIYPAKTDYIYFLAKGDGTTLFHKDYKEFLKDKEKYIK